MVVGLIAHFFHLLLNRIDTRSSSIGLLQTDDICIGKIDEISHRIVSKGVASLFSAEAVGVVGNQRQAAVALSHGARIVQRTVVPKELATHNKA